MNRCSHTGWFAVLWCGTLLVIGIFFVPATWDDSDDARMAMIAAGTGSFEGPSEYLLYTNVLLGQVLKTLEMHFPGIAWYGVYLATLFVFSNWVITWLVLLSFDRTEFLAEPATNVVPFKIALALVHASSFFHFWTHLQFTVVSSLSALAGVLLVLRGIQENRSLRYQCGGWFLVIVASLVRFHAAAMIGLLAMPFALYALWISKSKHLCVVSLVSATIGIGCILGCLQYDKYCYESRSRWATFFEMKSPMSKVINNRFLRIVFRDSNGSIIIDREDRIEQIEQVLVENGLTLDDLHSMFLWQYFDPDLFTAERFRALEEGLIKPPLDGTQIRLTAIGTVATLIGHNQFVLLLLGTFVFAFARADCGVRFAMVFWLYTLAILFLINLLQKLPARVFIPCAFTNFVLLLVVRSRPSQDSDSRFKRVLLTVLALASAWSLIEQGRNAHNRARTGTAFSNILAEQAKTEALYVYAVPTPFSTLSPFDDFSRYKGLHFIYLDGHQRSPRYYSTLHSLNLNELIDVFRNDFDREVFFIVNEKAGAALDRHLAQHHQIRDQLQLTTDFNWARCYRVTQPAQEQRGDIKQSNGH